MTDHPRHATFLSATLRRAFWMEKHRRGATFSSAAAQIGITRPALYRAVGDSANDPHVGKVTKATSARIRAWVTIARKRRKK